MKEGKESSCDHNTVSLCPVLHPFLSVLYETDINHNDSKHVE